MAREFVGWQRGQMLLMPPSLSEWLPEDHLVWTVLAPLSRWIWLASLRRVGWARQGGRPTTRR